MNKFEEFKWVWGILALLSLTISGITFAYNYPVVSIMFMFLFGYLSGIFVCSILLNERKAQPRKKRRKNESPPR